ncbi:hypothetical protein K438DRAFT_486126 [Mycena galopus ATCC 62051]|nr:hypothetical protein K438DRAFT_486126 [Mycena galopus ATCC 62051]
MEAGAHELVVATVFLSADAPLEEAARREETNSSDAAPHWLTKLLLVQSSARTRARVRLCTAVRRQAGSSHKRCGRILARKSLAPWGGDIRQRLKDDIYSAWLAPMERTHDMFEEFRKQFLLCPRRASLPEDEVGEDVKLLVDYWRQKFAEGGKVGVRRISLLSFTLYRSAGTYPFHLHILPPVMRPF